QGEAVDHRTDLFSLGSVMYAMCTGRAPFRAENTMAVLLRVIEDTPRPIREVNNDVPDWLCAIIEKLHAKNREVRYQSAREVGDVLSEQLAELQATGRAGPVDPGAVPRSRKAGAFAESREPAFGDCSALVATAGTKLLVTGIGTFSAWIVLLLIEFFMGA